MREVIGVSILTNGMRLGHLKRCLSSFLSNCHYRPLVIGLFDNGSEEDVKSWYKGQSAYGIEFRFDSSRIDLGCAAGTNRASQLVRDCRLVVHLESDFVHLPERLSGEDRMWLHRAVDFLDKSGCDFLYLRRMVGEDDIRLHWWDKWMATLEGSTHSGNYMECPGFWWSNNPHLRRNDAIYESGCLPLNESLDGHKGTENWGKPELQTARPGDRTWIHKWGVFAHDIDPDSLGTGVCPRYVGQCKYGFFRTAKGFCDACDNREGISGMTGHYRRYIGV